MGVISGVSMAVSGIPSVSKWTIRWEDNRLPVVTAGTGAAVLNTCGIPEWTGEIICLGHTPAYNPGDTMTFVGSLDGSVGVTGSARVQRVHTVADFNANRYYTIRYDILSDGSLTFGSAVASDTNMPTVVCPAGKSVKLDGNDLNDVAAWMVILERELLPYASSSTNGVMKRIPGVFMGTVVIDLIMNNNAIPSLTSAHDIELAVGAGANDKWILESFVLSAVQEYGVDLSQGVPRQETPVYRLIFRHSAASSKVIKKPGNVQVWPAS